jgi:hypothetical protein
MGGSGVGFDASVSESSGSVPPFSLDLCLGGAGAHRPPRRGPEGLALALPVLRSCHGGQGPIGVANRRPFSTESTGLASLEIRQGRRIGWSNESIGRILYVWFYRPVEKLQVSVVL